MKNKKTAAHVGKRKAAKVSTGNRLHSSSAAAQRQRILRALRAGPVSTITARSTLDILCPAARVLELRRAGYRIKTVWVWERTDCGKSHRVALYVLGKGA